MLNNQMVMVLEGKTTIFLWVFLWFSHKNHHFIINHFKPQMSPSHDQTQNRSQARFRRPSEASSGQLALLSLPLPAARFQNAWLETTGERPVSSVIDTISMGISGS
jgi:hypothetical protein